MMHPMGEEDSPNLGEGGGGEKRKDVAEFEIRCVKVEHGLSGKCSKGCCPKLYVTGKKKKKKEEKEPLLSAQYEMQELCTCSTEPLAEQEEGMQCSKRSKMSKKT